jgi:hypothetical protein
MKPVSSVVTILVLMLLAPIMGPRPAFAQGDTLLYADRFAVYDATGRQIGNAWPTSDSVWRAYHPAHLVVEFRFARTPVMVRLQRALFTPDGFASEMLQFSEPGCTGAPMIDGRLWNGYSAVAGPRSTLYLKAADLEFRFVQSQLNEDGTCTNHGPNHPFHEVILLRMTDIDLADHFVPPFTVRTRGQTPVPRVTP